MSRTMAVHVRYKSLHISAQRLTTWNNQILRILENVSHDSKFLAFRFEGDKSIFWLLGVVPGVAVVIA